MQLTKLKKHSIMKISAIIVLSFFIAGIASRPVYAFKNADIIKLALKLKNRQATLTEKEKAYLKEQALTIIEEASRKIVETDDIEDEISKIEKLLPEFVTAIIRETIYFTQLDISPEEKVEALLSAFGSDSDLLFVSAMITSFVCGYLWTFYVFCPEIPLPIFGTDCDQLFAAAMLTSFLTGIFWIFFGVSEDDIIDIIF